MFNIPMSHPSLSVSLASWDACSHHSAAAPLGLTLPPPDFRFILAQLVAPSSDPARMLAYRRFVNAPSSFSSSSTQSSAHTTAKLFEIRLADVAWDFERARPMHPLALKVCTNERIVGNATDGTMEQDRSLCTCEEGACCGQPKQHPKSEESDEDVGRRRGGPSDKPPEADQHRLASASNPPESRQKPADSDRLPRYECATATCAPLAPPTNDPHASTRLPSCCGGGNLVVATPNPRTWHSGVLAGHVRITSTTRADTNISSASRQPPCHDHHVQLRLEPDGPAATVRGLTSHIITVIANHCAQKSSDGLSNLLRRRQQRLESDRLLFAVPKQDLVLRVAMKQLGCVPIGPSVTVTGNPDDDGQGYIVYVARVTDMVGRHDAGQPA